MCTAESRMVTWTPYTSVDGGYPPLSSFRIDRKSIERKPKLSCPVVAAFNYTVWHLGCYDCTLKYIEGGIVVFSVRKYRCSIPLFNTAVQYTVASQLGQKITKMAAPSMIQWWSRISRLWLVNDKWGGAYWIGVLATKFCIIYFFILFFIFL